MEIIKNLDLRKMPHFERHEKIFEMLEALKNQEILRITNDHEPKPLFYMLQAEHPGEFDWKYEKEGPSDWIFKIKRISKPDNRREKIKELIKKLHTKEDLKKYKKEAKDLLENISPADLGMIEQEIIQEGITKKEMRKLCDIHLEVMRESLPNKELNLKPGHPIHTLMEEHKEILDFVDKLKIVVKKLEFSKSFKDVKMEIEMLRFAAKHLVEADKHHQREEEALFPEMEKYGVTEPPEIMREEHVNIKAKKEELYQLAKTPEKIPYHKFVKRVKEISEYLIEELPNHIYKEDNILYPMAIDVIPKENWKKLKETCDNIGYCCFTPKC